MSRNLARRQLAPYLLVGLLAAVVIPTGCSDEFKSCESTLTCGDGPETGGLGGEASGDGDPMSGGGVGGAGTPCPGAGCECTSDEILCEGECVDPLTSADFCGATDDCTDTKAGDTCGTDEDCVEGECILVCGAGRIVCDDTCVDPLEDPMYCGATGACTDADRGFECEPGEACLGGECRTWDEASVLATREDNHIAVSELAVGPTGKAVVHFLRGRNWSARVYNTSTSTWHAEQPLSEGDTLLTTRMAVTDGGKLLAIGSTYTEAWAMRTSVGVNLSFPDIAAIPNSSGTGATIFTSFGTGTGSAAVVAWRVDGSPGIRASIFNPSTNAWGEATSISSETTGAYPGSAANGTNALVVWDQTFNRLVASVNSGESWQTADVPGETPNGVALYPSALLNDSGEALVSYKTLLDNQPDETWGLSYSFEDDSWGSHFRIHSDPATLIATAQGSFGYALIDPDTKAEIWWRRSGESISEMQTAKRQVLLEQPAEQLIVVSNSVGQLMALFVSEDDIYWTVLDRESDTWSEAIPFGRSGDSAISGLDAGMDKYGRVIVSWRAANPDSVAPWDAVWTRRFE